MKKRKQWWTGVVMAASLPFMLQSPLGVRAQDAQTTANSQGPQDTQNADHPDPPSRIARLNYMQGSVSLQPAGENDWVTAVLNRPLVTGDNLWADEDSRAEVHIGSTALRLGPKTGITLLEVSDVAAQIRLAQGSLIVKVRHVDDEDSYEIDTHNIAFVVMQPGEYRIDVDPNVNRTDVTVWHGRGQVAGGGNSHLMMAKQHASFTGTTGDQLNPDLGQTADQSSLDSWALDRDQIEERSDSANYVSRDMTGYEDLDQYGSWSNLADYGPCWQPTVVVAGWAPYRFGHWIWVEPWGWTWVEDEPWGFAPFHYGRWALAGSAWVWVPGPNVARPVYAPALVAWVGGGPGLRLSAGVGVGWFPLAPGEVFIPGYRVSRTYVNNVNITNTAVNITRVSSAYDSVVVNRSANNITYANRNVTGGVTVVSHSTFVNARPVGRNVVSVSPKELAAVPASQALTVEPARSSALGAGRPANQPPAVVMSRPVVTLRTPAPMPGSFDQRRAQAGGHSGQQSSMGQSSTGPSLIRQPQSQDGLHPVRHAGAGSNLQPRVWEEQGTPEPEKSAEPEKGSAQPSAYGSRPLQQGAQAAQQGSHSLAKPIAPVQQKNEQQQKEQEQKPSNSQPQKPASPQPQRQQNTRPPVQKQESAPKVH
jgi:hypothetical protein